MILKLLDQAMALSPTDNNADYAANPTSGRTYQAILEGASADTVTAKVIVEVSNMPDYAWITEIAEATIVKNPGVAFVSVNLGVVSNVPWGHVRARVTAINNSGKVTVAMAGQ